MKTLLVHPRFPLTYWGFQHSLRLIGKQASLPPLGLLSLAALLPGHFEVRLADLNVAPLSDADLHWAEVVLTGGLLLQVESMHEIIERAHAHHLPAAVGGPAPTTSPEIFTDADIVFRGEAEGRIDELVDALRRTASGHRILDAPIGFPEMKTVPAPRFDLLDLSKYASMSGETFTRPNFLPRMDEQVLLKGYAELLGWLYSPDANYARCHAYQEHTGRRQTARASTSRELSALLRTIWHVGVLGPHRRHFWRLMGTALLHGRERLRQAVVHAVQGEHLIRYTREEVLPRLDRALAEIRMEDRTQSPRRPLPAARGAPKDFSPPEWRVARTGTTHEYTGSRDDTAW